MSFEIQKQLFLQGQYNKIISTEHTTDLIQDKLIFIESLIELHKFEQATLEISNIEKTENLKYLIKKEHKIMFLLLKALNITHPKDKETVFQLLHSAEEYLIKVKNSTIPLNQEFLSFLFIKGSIFFNFQLYEESFYFFEQCVKESILTGNKYFHTRALNKLAKINYEKESYEKALELSMRALAISTANNFTSEVVLGYEMLGLLNQNKNNDQALKYFDKCLQISKNQLENNLFVAKSLMNIGKTKLLQKEIDNAIHYLNESLKIFSRAAFETDLLVLLKTLGDAYLRKGNFQQAIIYYKDSLDKSLEQEKLIHQGHCYYALGTVYFKIRDFKNSFKFYIECLNIRKSLGHSIELAGPLWGIGHIQFISKNYNKALNHYLELYEIYKAFGRPEFISEILLIIITLQNASGDTEQNLKMLENLKNLHIEFTSEHTKQSYYIAQAIMKDESRLIGLIEKLELFETIVSNLMINPHFSYFSLLNLIKIYLLEFDLSHEEKIFSDIKYYAHKLRELAEKNHSYILELFVNVFLLHINYITSDKEENNVLLMKTNSIIELIQLKQIENDISKLLKKIDRLEKENLSKNHQMSLIELFNKIAPNKVIEALIVDKFWLS